MAACHDKRLGRRERVVDRVHLHGIVPCRRALSPDPTSNDRIETALPGIELLRSLTEDEQVAGGDW